jgi:hypothetical protein
MRVENFSGGERLKTKLQEILKKAGKGAEVKVGFLEGATYPDGTPVPLVAAMQEYGTSRIPSRPFFRQMIVQKSPGWGHSLAGAVKAADYDLHKALAMMGEKVADQLQDAIKAFDGVPLADVTVAKKGFEKQLIDTAVMINSVGYQVDGGEKVILAGAAKGGKP